MLPYRTFVLGGAASGKSDVAEKLLLSSGLKPVYIATAQAFDDEMAAKIAAHRAARGTGWRTVEAPLNLAAALGEISPDAAVLVDCVTLWLSNQLLAGSNLDTEADGLLAALERMTAPVIVVSNEVGQGIVPDNALSRRFRNAQGRLNRRLAAQADCVVGVMAGLPFALKGALPEGLA